MILLNDVVEVFDLRNTIGTSGLALVESIAALLGPLLSIVTFGIAIRRHSLVEKALRRQQEINVPSVLSAAR